MAEKELSREEKRALNVKNTLEHKIMQDVVGGNAVQQNPYMLGQLGLQSGKQTYLEAKLSDGFNEKRREVQAAEIMEQQRLGIAENPTISDYHVVKAYMNQLNEIQALATLEELEYHAKEVNAKLDYEVPEDLKKISEYGMMMEAKEKGLIDEAGRVNIAKLGDKYILAMEFKQNLTQAYERACAVNSAQGNYFADISQEGKKLVEAYERLKKEKGGKE